MKDIVNNILSVSDHSFASQALQTFRFQYAQNKVYQQWVDALRIDTDSVNELTQIPFLPISFFKTHQVVCGSFEPETIFESSGTTGAVTSRHFVKELGFYKESIMSGFRHFYGDPADFCVIGLLPSYLERKGSSLVMMVNDLIKSSGHVQSGFYLYDFQKLATVLQELEAKKQKTLLIGVTFALLDFAEQFPMQLRNTVIMETGGMKGRRKEMVREEVHAVLQQRFNMPSIHSEYGMTELLSQAYSFGNGIFNPVPWMKILVRDEDDPLLVSDTGRGVVNIIDLANVYSCSFIAADDAGKVYPDGSFEVLGRRDNSDIRGCSLMAL